MKKAGEIIETIVIYIALASLMPVIYWWHSGTLHRQRPYLIYLFVILCIMGYITYRRIKRLRSAFKSAKKNSRNSGSPFPPFMK
ncbi:TPA: hypothetical protein ENS27_09355 [bacterium]|jgi:uncharacterized membrane protein|nr:hypothetical protein [bacterium]